jgi:tetratricopeptide (TPR) repeat protein
MGQYDEAIADFDKAIRHSPEFSAAYVDRGLAFNAKKDYVAALKDFDTAIKLEPQEISTLDFALNAKAWTLATCPLAAHRDGKTAVELATKACKITRWNSPDCLGTLAAAYAETGQFEEAVRWQEKALTDDEYRKEWGATAENCSKQYRNGMPHREE